jgi:hypothetical protein
VIRQTENWEEQGVKFLGAHCQPPPLERLENHLI